jgi:glycosyltransferase involved in cell wall biosynthesis
VSASELQKVTPVVLTYNEEQNIRRTLDSLRWAANVVVVDSESTDLTEKIALSYENVRWHVRTFDNHLRQWSYGIRETGIESEYILALDADMQVTTAFLSEVKDRLLAGNYDGGLVPFEYHYYGHRLRGSLCPPQIRIFKRNRVAVRQPDHTQHFSVEGRVYRFKSCLLHDDRKPLERFVSSQLAYQVLNEKELANGGRKRFRDYLRKLGLMPPIVGTLAYIRAGGPFYGAVAVRYAYERALCESLLAIRLMNRRLEDERHD